MSSLITERLQLRNEGAGLVSVGLRGADIAAAIYNNSMRKSKFKEGINNATDKITDTVSNLGSGKIVGGTAAALGAGIAAKKLYNKFKKNKKE